jgi:hypothetical protein
VGVLVAVELRVLGGDGDDLVVLFALVDHRHQADRPRVDQRERDDGFLAEHEHVKRVVVLRQRLRDEAVVGRVVDGRVQHAVELDQAGDLVELVLHRRAEGDLDDGVELLRDVLAGGDVVPGVDHRSALDRAVGFISGTTVALPIVSVERGGGMSAGG